MLNFRGFQMMNFQNSFITVFLFFSIFVSIFHLQSGENSAYGYPGGLPFSPSPSTRVYCHLRAFFDQNFSTEQECGHLIQPAKDRLQKALVADVKTDKSKESTLPMSKDMFIREMKEFPAKGSECATKVSAVKPNKVDALLIHSRHHKAKMERMSLHRRSGRELLSTSEGEDCRDEFIGCFELSARGECEGINAPNMIGSAHSPGKCRKTCGGC